MSSFTPIKVPFLWVLYGQRKFQIFMTNILYPSQYKVKVFNRSLNDAIALIHNHGRLLVNNGPSLQAMHTLTIPRARARIPSCFYIYRFFSDFLYLFFFKIFISSVPPEAEGSALHSLLKKIMQLFSMFSVLLALSSFII